MHRILKVLSVCLLLLMVEHVSSQVPSASYVPSAPSVSSVSSAPSVPSVPSGPTQSHYIGAVRQQPSSPAIPSDVSVPSGSSFSFLLYGSGNNGWLCQSGSWTLNNTNVYFINDNDGHFDPAFEIAHLFWQPAAVNGGRTTFQSLLSNDTSSIITKPDSSVASPENTTIDNSPWERQTVVNTTQGGAFSDISYVVIVSTYHGASPPASTCGVQYLNDTVTNISFTATYYFYKGPPPAISTSTRGSSPMSSATGFSAIGQLGWIAIAGLISVGVMFF